MGLESQINRVRQHIDDVKTTPGQSTSSGEGNDVTSSKRMQISQVVQAYRDRATVPLDHAIVLVKHLV